MNLKFEFLKNLGVLFYIYVTISLNLQLKDTIQWQNPFQNLKKNHFRWKKFQKRSNNLLNKAW